MRRRWMFIQNLGAQKKSGGAPVISWFMNSAIYSYIYVYIYIEGYGSIPINTIFRGMNIHLPAIFMFTRGTRFWHTAIYIYIPWVNHQVSTSSHWESSTINTSGRWNLVGGGIPTPLKNDGLRQLGWWNSQLNGKIKNVPNHQPDIYIYRQIPYPPITTS